MLWRSFEQEFVVMFGEAGEAFFAYYFCSCALSPTTLKKLAQLSFYFAAVRFPLSVNAVIVFGNIC